VEQRKQDLKDSLIAIYGMREEDITYSVLGRLYYITRQNIIPIDIVESVFQQSISQMPTFLSKEKRSSLYVPHIAEAYYVLKKYQEVLDKSNEALKLNSRNAIGYNIKGLALTELGRYDEAVECFGKALEIDPNFASAWMHKGNALDYSRNYKEAMKCYDKALEIDPNYLALLIWMNRGACFHRWGKYKEAIECYDKALKIVHYEKPLHMRLFDLSTREHYLLQMNSYEAHTWSLKGDSLHELGKYEDAIDAYSESLKLNAADADTWRNKGKSLFVLGKYDDAIDVERELLNLNAADGDAWLREGTLHLLLDEYKEAIGCYDHVLKIDPNHAEASYFKGKAETRHKNI
jgi:tetratricopeptide (TPR) repeat protein